MKKTTLILPLLCLLALAAGCKNSAQEELAEKELQDREKVKKMLENDKKWRESNPIPSVTYAPHPKRNSEAASSPAK